MHHQGTLQRYYRIKALNEAVKSDGQGRRAALITLLHPTGAKDESVSTKEWAMLSIATLQEGEQLWAPDSCLLNEGAAVYAVECVAEVHL